MTEAVRERDSDPEELANRLKRLKDDFDTMTPEEQRTAAYLLMDIRDHSLNGEVWKAFQYIDFSTTPLPFLSWLRNDEFAGHIEKDLWSYWKREIQRVTDPKKGISEWYVTGCIGGGKTFAALLATLYKGPYFCSCMRDPHRTFGLAKNSEIVFGLFNAILTNATRIDFNQLVRFVQDSPYFKNSLRTVIMQSDCSLNWPDRNMRLTIGSSEMHALGANLFSFLIDEVNFMKTPETRQSDEHQAYKIYHHATRRVKSRFQKFGYSPGLACIVSSRLATSSFLERLMEENRGSPAVHVTDISLWKVKGRRNFSPVEFRVVVGDQYKRAEMLDEIDTHGSPNTFLWTLNKETRKKNPKDGRKLILVPADFYFDFRRDINGSLRDIAGEPTYGVNRLIQRPEAVLECIDTTRLHPFLAEEHTLGLQDTEASLTAMVQWREMASIKQGAWFPHNHPGEPRFIHVDLGLTGDCAAIAMGCAFDKYIVTEFDPETGQAADNFRPKVWVDFMVRIRPTHGDQIDLTKIVEFILNLTHQGFNIQRVTFDGFASEMAIQHVLKANLLPFRTNVKRVRPDEVVKLEAYVVSVDKDDKPYRLLRDTIQANAISYYRYQPFIDEVLALEHDVRKTENGVVKGRVDHPHKGSKDVADAVCGMVWGIATAKTAAPANPTPLIIGDRPSTRMDEQISKDIIADYGKDAARIKALVPPPIPTPQVQTATGRRPVTRENWTREIPGFNRHRLNI